MDKIKVLFIDDDIDFGKMLSLALEENGIKVYYSNSLAGIVAAIKEISPNIILLDVEIGTQSGIDMLPQIKAVALHTPILFVSSHHESEVAIQAIQKSYGERAERLHYAHPHYGGAETALQKRLPRDRCRNGVRVQR